MRQLDEMLGEPFVSDRPADEAVIAEIEGQWGAIIPPDHREFLLHRGRFDGALLDASGAEVVEQFRILSVPSIDDDLGYAVFEEAPELLPVAGMDAWRYCLRRGTDGGVDYVDLDLGTGAVTAGFGRPLTELVARVLCRASA